ncbi:hypothetical protein IE53DRAFT_287699 [Violaceomyces palustris]|uniref:Uncharacterized protein n=1 Tax=Violaceomyces palustris TaxID=1673888 RepID=A0ACD0NM08_9BASI|nr:hypothetical protein IE53DRAFT_287699 [Violaceomyces palustris]
MPRKRPPLVPGLAPIASSPLATPEEIVRNQPPLHPITKKLRRSWKFAATCQFLFVFDEAFGMSGFETESLEQDFEGSETGFLPDLMRRLLYTLTLDKRIDNHNWQDYLRIQFLLRDPEANKLGTVDSPIPWTQLELEDKITALHNLCEWQLQDPERFRKIVKSEDDSQAWRISPIGWDAEDNAYWLFDDNRIWIQRAPPPPPVVEKPRAPAKKGSKRARMEAAAAKRQAAALSTKSKEGKAPTTTTTPVKSSPLKRGRASDVGASSSNPATPSKRARTESNGEDINTPTGKSQGTPKPPPRKGTRSSKRFATNPEDEASSPQAADESKGIKSGRVRRSGEDSESELSDPPEEEREVGSKRPNGESTSGAEGGVSEVGGSDAMQVEELVEPSRENSDQGNEKGNGNQNDEQDGQDGWVEFEAICVTKAEWQVFAKKFAKSKDANEVNLHNFVNQELLPRVLAEFDEIERQKMMELALANRKRSSRIALKESEREERERDRIARAKMEERMAKLRAEEKEKEEKEEAERMALKAREERIREREERILAREREAEEKAQREEDERERREREREERKRRRDEIIANGGVPPASFDTPKGDGTDGWRTPKNEHEIAKAEVKAESLVNGAIDALGRGSGAETGRIAGEDEEEDSWELDCEVCGKAGINPLETKEIVCCEQCGVWQHLQCWDKFDKSVGMRKRDWEGEDFFCSKCRPPQADQPIPTRGMAFGTPNKKTTTATSTPSKQSPSSRKVKAALETSPGSIGKMLASEGGDVVKSQGSLQDTSVPASLQPRPPSQLAAAPTLPSQGSPVRLPDGMFGQPVTTTPFAPGDKAGEAREPCKSGKASEATANLADSLSASIAEAPAGNASVSTGSGKVEKGIDGDGKMKAPSTSPLPPPDAPRTTTGSPFSVKSSNGLVPKSPVSGSSPSSATSKTDSLMLPPSTTRTPSSAQALGQPALLSSNGRTSHGRAPSPDTVPPPSHSKDGIALPSALSASSTPQTTSPRSSQQQPPLPKPPSSPSPSSYSPSSSPNAPNPNGHFARSRMNSISSSFPMRYSAARSPLSQPFSFRDAEGVSEDGKGGVDRPPTVEAPPQSLKRAGSPSPNGGGPRVGEELVTGRVNKDVITRRDGEV